MLISLALSGCTLFRACSDDPECVRVLFIGNSYIFVNDLPRVFTELARSGGKRAETGMLAQGGWTLSQHAAASETLNQIRSSKWNFVVLQEQSQIPANAAARDTQMYPAARKLSGQIRKSGAIPVLFITWAHRDGWPDNGLNTYESMQRQINGGYMALGQQLKVPMAPVGYAWLEMKQKYPTMELWQLDGSHPNEQGTYLAACIFYAVIFQKSPEQLSYIGNLSKDNAAILQNLAAGMVLNNAKKWNLP